VKHPTQTIVGWRGDGNYYCGPCGWVSYHDDRTGDMTGVTDCEGRRVVPVYDIPSDRDIHCIDCDDLILRGMPTCIDDESDMLARAAIESPVFVPSGAVWLN
jgi:hypothetical protein